jgi:hypothetical protein
VIRTGWLTETIYVDTVYEASIEQYLLRVNNPGMRYVRMQRQALKECQVETFFLNERIWVYKAEKEAFQKVVSEQDSTIITLKQANRMLSAANTLGDQEIVLHMQNANAWKRQARLWKGVAIGGATLVVVGAGAITYILITAN